LPAVFAEQLATAAACPCLNASRKEEQLVVRRLSRVDRKRFGFVGHSRRFVDAIAFPKRRNGSAIACRQRRATKIDRADTKRARNNSGLRRPDPHPAKYFGKLDNEPLPGGIVDLALKRWQQRVHDHLGEIGQCDELFAVGRGW
jgi:hypothetical protein